MSSNSDGSGGTGADSFPRANPICGVLANGMSLDLLLHTPAAVQLLRSYGGTALSTLLKSYPRAVHTPTETAPASKDKSKSSAADESEAITAASNAAAAAWTAAASVGAAPFVLDSSLQPVSSDELVQSLQRESAEPYELQYRIRSDALHLLATELATKGMLCVDGAVRSLADRVLLYV